MYANELLMLNMILPLFPSAGLDFSICKDHFCFCLHPEWLNMSWPGFAWLTLTVGSVWPKPASISSIEEYGAPAFPSLLKFNYTVYIQPILLYDSETWALTRALEDRIAAFDNTCLRRILRISYMDHFTNADVHLRAGCPPQLLPLIQTRQHAQDRGRWKQLVETATPSQGHACVDDDELWPLSPDCFDTEF